MTPVGAQDWQHKVEEGFDRWLALVPNALDRVLAVYEKVPGAWYAMSSEGNEEAAPEHAPPLSAGPFPSAEDAKRAADEWCAKWAPRVVDLPGVYALRICSDGMIRMSAFDSVACTEGEKTLTPKQARVFAEALLALAEEASASAGDCTR